MRRYFFILLLGLLGIAPVQAASKPNIVLVITDDQGIGDLSIHGNPFLMTPHTDRIAQTGARFTRFLVAPVCAPTRAGLLTGRYYYRTGVVDTFIGRAMMHPDEVTLAETLQKAGYRTGQFGKWHLGDSYPLRPQDQGFQETLMLKGGGLVQPSDPPGGSSYFDPHLWHNGKAIQPKGYITDIITDGALAFIDQPAKEPFFAYIAYNAPHGPLQLPEKYHEPFKGGNFGPEKFPKEGHPWKDVKPEATARVYGMVKNIDDNLGRLLTRLEEKKLRDNTIFIFMTDNGPQDERYKMGLRGAKGSVFEGGIRVPFFLSWPAGVKAGLTIDTMAGHIDVVPTLLDLCGVERGEGPAIDGRSLVPLLKDPAAKWPERMFFTQWHRGDTPEKGRAFTAIGPRWKLVQPQGVQPGSAIKDAPLLLFDLLADPGEQNNRAGEHPAVVAEMKKAYDTWFDDVAKTRNFQPPRIVLGSDAEKTTTLTRQDWRGPKSGWTPTSVGHWEVDVKQAGPYKVTIWFAPVKEMTSVVFKVGDATAAPLVAAGDKKVTLMPIKLPLGPGRVEAIVGQGANAVGVTHVELTRE